jgi:hypothetical protein
MKPATILRNPIVQIGYHVPDIEAVARQFADNFGWGPFFVMHHVELKQCIYRGKPATLDHGLACGQAGPIMVELNQQYGDEPSIFRDMYAANQFGVQHHASFADDVDEEVKRYNSLGFPTAMRASTSNGVDYAFIDTRPLFGYMVELYPRSDGLMQWYDMVREAAREWDGRDPVRLLTR